MWWISEIQTLAIVKQFHFNWTFYSFLSLWNCIQQLCLGQAIRFSYPPVAPPNWLLPLTCRPIAVWWWTSLQEEKQAPCYAKQSTSFQVAPLCWGTKQPWRSRDPLKWKRPWPEGSRSGHRVGGHPLKYKWQFACQQSTRGAWKWAPTQYTWFSIHLKISYTKVKVFHLFIFFLLWHSWIPKYCR